MAEPRYPPRMLVGIKVSLQAVLDLTNPASVPHQLSLEELLSEDWRKMNGRQKESRSQALGRVVADLGGIVGAKATELDFIALWIWNEKLR